MALVDDVAWIGDKQGAWRCPLVASSCTAINPAGGGGVRRLVASGDWLVVSTETVTAICSIADRSLGACRVSDLLLAGDRVTLARSRVVAVRGLHPFTLLSFSIQSDLSLASEAGRVISGGVLNMASGGDTIAIVIDDGSGEPPSVTVFDMRSQSDFQPADRVPFLGKVQIVRLDGQGQLIVAADDAETASARISRVSTLRWSEDGMFDWATLTRIGLSHIVRMAASGNKVFVVTYDQVSDGVAGRMFLSMIETSPGALSVVQRLEVCPAAADPVVHLIQGAAWLVVDCGLRAEMFEFDADGRLLRGGAWTHPPLADLAIDDTGNIYGVDGVGDLHVFRMDGAVFGTVREIGAKRVASCESFAVAVGTNALHIVTVVSGDVRTLRANAMFGAPSAVSCSGRKLLVASIIDSADGEWQSMLSRWSDALSPDRVDLFRLAHCVDDLDLTGILAAGRTCDGGAVDFGAIFPALNRIALPYSSKGLTP